jgi:hypothetical protein
MLIFFSLVRGRVFKYKDEDNYIFCGFRSIKYCHHSPTIMGDWVHCQSKAN